MASLHRNGRFPLSTSQDSGKRCIQATAYHSTFRDSSKAEARQELFASQSHVHELKLPNSRALDQAKIDKVHLTSRAENADRTVATLCEQLERLRGSLDVNSRLVEKLEHELGAAHAELKSHAEEAAKPPSKALASFSQSFPQGFDIIPTASIDAQCGFYAVIESIEAMNLAGTSRHLPVPSCADLLEAFESDDVQQKYLTMYTDMGYSDEVAVGLIDHKGYFRIEEVAVALDHWASTKHDLKFQIGYLEKYQSCEGVLKDNPQGEPLEQGYRLPQLLGGKHDDDPERIVVWLHHNGAGENSLLAHYSGMRNHIPSS